MALKAIHATLEEIPEAFRELFTEKGGKFELTGITGVKTQADIDRMQTGLTAERDDHKATKEKLAIWGDLDHAATVASLDRIPELEAAGAGKLDEAGIEAIVTKRVEGTLASKLAPVERQLVTALKERDTFAGENETFKTANTRRRIHDTVRKALVAQKVRPEAHEDALMLAERIMEVSDAGAVVTRDNVGVAPGLDSDGWLAEIQDSRPHWWPDSQGGGARGSQGAGGMSGKNPFSHDGWNMTAQGQLVREKGMEHAKKLAAAAGTTVGGPQPAKK